MAILCSLLRRRLSSIRNFAKLNYDPLTSFEPICLLVNSPNVIAVNGASPYHALADLFDAARGKPGDLTLAAVGPATSSHIAIEMLKRVANVSLTFIPYPGAPPAVNALLGEHVTAFFGSYPNVAMNLNAGKLRALATASRTRIDLLPDVPTIAESGYKDYEANLWFGLFAPAKTPKDMVSHLAGWFGAALQDASAKAKLVAQGLYPAKMCGADFENFVRKQHEEYGRVIRAANIRVE